MRRFEFTNRKDSAEYYDVDEETMKRDVHTVMIGFQGGFIVGRPEVKVLTLGISGAEIKVDEEFMFLPYTLLFPSAYVSVMEGYEPSRFIEEMGSENVKSVKVKEDDNPEKIPF